MGESEFKEIIGRRFLELMNKYPLMKSVGGEYISQSDSTELIGDIYNFFADMCDTYINGEECTTW